MTSADDELNFDKDYFGMKYSGTNCFIDDTAGKDDSSGVTKSMYTLTFTYDFEYDKDTVFFSHLHPYTTADLEDYLDSVEKKDIKGIYRRDIL